MPRNQRPFNAEKIETYEDLRFYARKFGQGCYRDCPIHSGRLKVGGGQRLDDNVSSGV